MSRLVLLACACAAMAAAQQPPDLRLGISGPGKVPILAVPDFRGDAQTQPLMATFNETLWRDLDDSGFFQMAPKTQYPLDVPQQPSDLRAPRDWSAPPAAANYLAIGYSAVLNGSFLLRGWLLDVPGAGQVFEKRYGVSVDGEGARKAAHQFAADILTSLGGVSLLGTHIYFVRESRPAPDRQTEIWVMDPDGANQRRIAGGNSIFTQPAVLPGGSMIAFVRVYPWHEVMLYSADPPRQARFANAGNLSAVAAPSFTADGKRILFAQSIKGTGMRLVSANLDGSDPQFLTDLRGTDTEPKLNPRNPTQLAFVSGRSGPQQIYTMNLDGTGVERISAGTGEASNPSWHPSGRFLAFAWTRGFAPGAWNIFVMNVATGETSQLTHGEGRNENPVWAPDGIHIVFSSTRSGKSQIWSMLGDGSHLRQLTTEGVNSTPTWGK